VPVGLLRAPGCRRSIHRRPKTKRIAIGRLGLRGGGSWAKIYLRFPRRFWPERPKWFGRLPDSPERRGTFNTWISQRAGNWASHPAQLQQRRDGPRRALTGPPAMPT